MARHRKVYRRSIKRTVWGNVRVQPFDLFDADCPGLPDGTQLPLVLIEGKVLSSGGKISTPAIRKCVEALGITSNGH